MNCQNFELNIADYITGRLNPAEAALMVAHRETCVRCAQAEQEERRLSARFAAVPDMPATLNLWPQLAMQLPERRRRFALPRLWFTAPVFTAAAVALAFFWFQFQPITSGPPPAKPDPVIAQTGVTPMTNLVNEVRDIGVAETDMLWEETRATHQMGIVAASEEGAQ